MEEVLEKIKRFAHQSHGEQVRRYSQDPYIVHPIRVMQTCRQFTNDITVLAAALLHDVLEDTSVTREQLHAFLEEVMTEEQAAHTVSLVEELTDVYIKPRYPHWNRRKRKMKEAARLEKASDEAQTIKYADIIDNAPEIAEKDPDFAQRFLPEYLSLLKRITSGEPRLYKQALETVYSCLPESKDRH
ncbi:bifunctional (p)ppGpp synthetase/guanosine-3',5'-bis(diphosphate) 3'-pyrophosphohydrolase [Segetibacter sp. 3557_3]|uniref:HD domain-containing protein n=1 Tax=Segetibacter sp. 3557_3 TaxID=2547429 RepID=UPI0010591FC4|nr:HD domain-containing protein [Segetibacter sp. 3557_3]TDH19724.1 bifunctional (p)ppGpp synthetase/guanosine-3',5'-bis(diphosphate) 3'-pyrophosphohydrolase [Segetibacter sp. 3557_3]